MATVLGRVGVLRRIEEGRGVEIMPRRSIVPYLHRAKEK